MSRNFCLGFGAGLLAGVVGTMAPMGGRVVSRAMAQDPNTTPTVPGRTQRYELSSWAHPAAYNAQGNINSREEHGAYILDTQTGKVWQVKEGGEPRSLGKIE
jgi:hypothetical protein